MADKEYPPNPVSDEFVKLGENLRDLLSSAWESEERKKVTDDVKTGLNQLVTAFTRLANEFPHSEAGQSIRAELNDLQDRVKAGEAQSKIQEDVLHLLQLMNRELSKLTEKWSSQASEKHSDNSSRTI